MYKVYWTDLLRDNNTYGLEFADLIESLEFTQRLRKEGKKYVTMVSENPDCVSLTGATGMDAKDYEWKKRR